MANAKVTITGLGAKFVQKQISVIVAISERQMEEMARETELVIQNKIQEHPAVDCIFPCLF